MTSTLTELDALYRVRKGEFALVDVPELGYVMIEGAGPPEGGDFAAALQALYAVTYGAHFALKKERGEAPKIRALEAQWWVDPGRAGFAQLVASGPAAFARTDRAGWHWQAMIIQPEPIDAEVIARAIEEARAKKDLPALDRLRYERWAEGRCGQVLHIGPYAEEGPSIARLHEGIAEAGCRPRGRHHEIYLGDPRRAAPERLRTILRQPVEPVPPPD
jgi:hypothetical protein